MKIHRWLLAGIVAGITALAVSSCAYDPYYSGASYSSGGGYGDGYGYGGSNFSTSFFVSTGNPRWGYDPYAGSYYDYTRRSYYDPYLYGYYPRGYRPRYVHGSPHPHGWSRGRNSIAPPSRIRNHNLNNYQNRGERYRGLGKDWSRNVRVNTPGRTQHTQNNREQRNPGVRDQRSPNYRDPRSGNSGRGSSGGGTLGSGQRPNRGGGILGGGSRPDQGRTFGEGNRGQNTRPQPGAVRGQNRRDPNAGRPSAPDRTRGGFINSQSPIKPQPSYGGSRGSGVREQAPQPQIRRERQPRQEMQPRGGSGDRGRGESRGGSGGSRGGESRGRGVPSPRGLGQG